MVGQTLGHYKILEMLGKGGMGEVYRANDSVLGREVAIKVLPAEFTEDPDRLARFEREAKVLAALNHPHIAAIYGLEQDDGQRFLVLELVEGETLAESIWKGALPVEEAIRLAIQIAQALEAAHDKGVVHRDLKPANIKITPDGEVKVLDFGLAKPTEAVFQGDLTESPTLTYAPTGVGVILGTAAYMSPEQVRGQEVDKRSDIWAFGVVLWEMLTGKKLFQGNTVSDVLASTLMREPDWEGLPPALPTAVTRVLRRCLVQDPKGRLHDIADARIELEEEPEVPTQAVDPSRPLWLRALPWLAAILAAAGAWLLKPESVPGPLPVVRFEVAIPEGERLAHHYYHGLEVSPDGRVLAFVSGVVNRIDYPETSQIYLRSLDSWQVRPVPGTEKGFQPIFSPDGKWLAFVTWTPNQVAAELWKTPVEGGEVTKLCEVEAAVTGASWGPDGTIVIGSFLAGLQMVSAAGGEPEMLTELNEDAGDGSHRLPHFLPDGSAVLYSAIRAIDLTNSEVLVYSLRTGKHKKLIEDALDARYVESGHLVFARTGKLFAVLFDPESHEILGPEVPVLDGVSHSLWLGNAGWNTGAAQFSVSTTGVLALARGSVAPERKRPLMLVDRLGNESQVDIEEKQYLHTRMSSDGTSILLSTNYPPWAVWVFDGERGTLSRQTFVGRDSRAVWGPDPEQFTFRSEFAGESRVYVKRIGTGPEDREQLTDLMVSPSSWSSDGEYLAAVGYRSDALQSDIWIVRRNGDAEPWLETQYMERYPEFSPDGRWIVYGSDESGRPEVYIRPFPGPGPAIQISAGGAVEPAWSRTGDEILYRDSDNEWFYSVKIHDSNGELIPARPVKLFERRYTGAATIRHGDVTPDGRLLMIPMPGEDVMEASLDALMPSRISVVHNWFAELKEKVPAN